MKTLSKAQRRRFGQLQKRTKSSILTDKIVNCCACNGTGMNSFTGEDCMDCKGKGFVLKYRNHKDF